MAETEPPAVPYPRFPVARDLALPMRVIGHPTVREDDGLAMSSRNVYLSPEQRRIAVAMNQVIAKAAKEVGEGLEIAAVTARARAALTAAGFDRVDYVEVRDAETLASPDPASARALRVLAAAWLGKTRLIDNCAAASPAADKPRKRSR